MANGDYSVEIEMEVDLDKYKKTLEESQKYARDTGEKIDQDLKTELELNIDDLEQKKKQIKNKLKELDESSEEARKLRIEFRTDSRELTEAKRKLNNLLNTGDATTSRLQQKFDKLGDAFGNTKAEIGKIREELEKSGKSTKYLEKIENKLSQLNQELADGKIDATQFKKELDKLENQAQSGGKSFGDLANMIKGVGVALGGITVVNQVGGYLVELDRSLNKLKVSSGATAEEFSQMKDSFIALNRSGHVINEDNIKVLSKIKKELGLVGDEATNLGRQYLAIAEIHDKDVNEVLRASIGLTRNFGIEASKSNDIIAATLKKSGDLYDDVLDTFNEYSVIFAKAGYSAEEFGNILVNGSEKGAFMIDKVGDAVKEATISLLDNSKSTRETFQALGLDYDSFLSKLTDGEITIKDGLAVINEKLGELDSGLRDELGTAIYKTKWEDLGEDVVFSLTDIEDKLGDVTNQANLTADDLEKGLYKQWEQIKGEFSDTGTKVLPFLIKGLKSLLVIIYALFYGVKMLFTGFIAFGDGLISLFRDVMSSISNSFINIFEFLKNFKKNTIAFFKNFTENYKIFGKNMGAAFSNALSGNMKKGLNKAIEGVSNFLNSAGKKLSEWLKGFGIDKEFKNFNIKFRFDESDIQKQDYVGDFEGNFQDVLKLKNTKRFTQTLDNVGDSIGRDGEKFWALYDRQFGEGSSLKEVSVQEKVNDYREENKKKLQALKEYLEQKKILEELYGDKGGSGGGNSQLQKMKEELGYIKDEFSLISKNANIDEQLKNQEGYLEALKILASEYGENTEEYKEIQGEIAKGELKQKELLEEKFSLTKKGYDETNKAIKQAQENIEKYEDGIQKVKEKYEELGEKIEDIDEKIGNIGKDTEEKLAENRIKLLEKEKELKEQIRNEDDYQERKKKQEELKKIAEELAFIEKNTTEEIRKAVEEFEKLSDSQQLVKEAEKKKKVLLEQKDIYQQIKEGQMVNIEEISDYENKKLAESLNEKLKSWEEEIKQFEEKIKSELVLKQQSINEQAKLDQEYTKILEQEDSKRISSMKKVEEQAWKVYRAKKAAEMLSGNSATNSSSQTNNVKNSVTINAKIDNSIDVDKLGKDIVKKIEKGQKGIY